jgi:hypothetical protein
MTNTSFEQLHPREGVGVNKGRFATKILDKGSSIVFDDDLDLEDPPYIDENGVSRWIQRGQLHRERGPAVEYPDGTKEWRINGELHREGGPARELPDGTKEWYLHGQLHNEDGPARELPNGTKEWYLHGERHRDGGPAKEEPDGSYEWYSHGQLHRDGGPAFESRSASFNSWYKKWYVNGELHREGGPAVEHSNGDQEWYVHGKLHREGAPAICARSSISRKWYVNGEQIPGPVVEDVRNQCSELENLPHFSGTTFEGECVSYHFGKNAGVAVERTPEGGLNVLYSYNRLKSDPDRLDAAFKVVERLKADTNP